MGTKTTYVEEIDNGFVVNECEDTGAEYKTTRTYYPEEPKITIQPAGKPPAQPKNPLRVAIDKMNKSKG